MHNRHRCILQQKELRHRTTHDLTPPDDDTVPAGKLRPQGDLYWLVDRAAAGRWAQAGEGTPA